MTKGQSVKEGTLIGAASDEISIWTIAEILVRRRKTVLRCAAVLTAFAALVAIVRPSQYTVEVSFKPESSASSLGELSSLAAQFGVAVPGAAALESPEYYATLIRSREVLLKVLSSMDSVSINGDLVSLESLLRLDDPDAAIRREVALEWLRDDALTISTGRETGVVNVSARTKWPVLSRDLVRSVLISLDEFNTAQRRSRAASERTFVEGRWRASRDSLTSAEAALRSFLRSNRAVDGSPDLRFERDRLQREVTQRQGLYDALSQALEQARIAEVRDTPVITVIQSPYVPPAPDRRNVALIVLVGLIFGLVAGIGLALFQEHLVPSDSRAESALRTLISSVSRRKS